MALNFPDSPTLNQVHTDTTSGFSYQWDGAVWQSYSESATDNISIVDDISSLFNGVTDTFALAVSGSSISPGTAQQMRVVLGGIVQEPLTDYTVSGSNIVFSTPPSGGLDCSIVSLGRSIPLSVAVIGDGTVTPAKLSTGGPSWNTGGDVYISGTTTIADVVKVGVGTTSLIVEGDARITGILTIGTSSVTIDGVNNQISIGTLKITESGISGGTPNITVGVVTASSAVISGNVSIAGTLTYEDVTNVDSIGIITARSGVRVTDGTVVVGSAVTLSSGGITVGVVTATRVSIDGDVGIGTTNPSQKLHVIGNSLVSGIATFGNITSNGNITETVYALSGTTPVLEPDNGTIQTWTLSGASTPTDGFSDGQSMTLMIDDGTAYTITWPSVTWVGGSAPTLKTTNYTIVELWKVSTTLYGALVGAT